VGAFSPHTAFADQILTVLCHKSSFSEEITGERAGKRRVVVAKVISTCITTKNVLLLLPCHCISFNYSSDCVKEDEMGGAYKTHD
jgi:hypothetical protein